MISSKRLAHKLIALVKGGSDPREVAQAFAEVSKDSGFKDVLRNAIVYLEKYARLERERRELVVEVAAKLPDDLLGRATRAFGDNEGAHVVHNPEVVGGVSVEKGDLLFDASIKGRLKNLRKSLA